MWRVLYELSAGLYSVGVERIPNANRHVMAALNLAGEAQPLLLDGNGNLDVTGGTGSATGATNGSVGADGSGDAQPTSSTQLGYYNGASFLPVQAGQGLPVSDGNSAAWQGVVALTPGSASPATPGRGLGFVCTAPGTLTMTLANGSTMAFPIAASAFLQTLGFAVTGVARSGGAAGAFWSLV